ncbi:hypothetical protein F5050DRAFT_648151 [Lentinula boryana]|uniref:Secreted protein n=1 Tax=Lentinula boryana TaxID=40481 RepID=A0ABQ8Q5E6_9AGAR|nr:hypothetical protein F5050DRAFT_648151 [Lentinula boryana]
MSIFGVDVILVLACFTVLSLLALQAFETSSCWPMFTATSPISPRCFRFTRGNVAIAALGQRSCSPNIYLSIFLPSPLQRRSTHRYKPSSQKTRRSR